MLESIWTILLIISIIFFLWVLPIYLGIKIAKRKNISPLWMWFAIHPVFGWIAVLVLNSAKTRKICPNCKETLKSHAKICPYCLTEQEIELPNSNEKKQTKLTTKLVISAIIITLITPYFYFYFTETPTSESWAYQNGINKAKNHYELIELLEEPIIPGEIISQSSSWSDGVEIVKIEIKLDGNKSSGILFIKANKNGEKWEFENLKFEEDNSNKTINLLKN